MEKITYTINSNDNMYDSKRTAQRYLLSEEERTLKTYKNKKTGILSESLVGVINYSECDASCSA